MMNGILEFLSAIHSAMADGESINIQLTRRAGSVDLTLIPKMPLSDDEVPDKAKQLRAVLATPLCFTGESLDTISCSFAERLKQYSVARSKGCAVFDELIENIHDATANAKNAAVSEADKVSKEAKPKAKTKPKSKPAEKDDSEVSLELKPNEDLEPLKTSDQYQNNGVFNF